MASDRNAIEVVARWIEEGGPGVNLESTRKLMAETVRALASTTGEAEPVGCNLCGGTGGHWEGCKAPNNPAATPVAPGEVTDALKQWAWHWFGPEADEEWIAKALANLPPAALHPLFGVDQRGLEVAASFVQLHAPDSPLYDHLRSIAARIRPAALSSPAPVAAPANEQLLEWLAKNADIEVSMVRADGKPMSKGERFAAGFVGDKDGLTAEWRLTFNTDYGLHESEDDLRAAIQAAKGSKS